MIKQAAIACIFALGLTTNSFGQIADSKACLGPVARKTLEYFDQIKE